MKNKVFLGGVCGDTTWRKTIAIPALEAAGVSYYNPQLGPGEWTPAHQALEAQAKTEAKIWLFVVDGSTRGVASMVEAAFAIGKGIEMVLVLGDVAPDAPFVSSPSEAKDLNRGRAYLREVAVEAGIPIFDTPEAATAAVIGSLGLMNHSIN